MTCATMERLKQDEQDFCDQALEFDQGSELAMTYRDYANAAKATQMRHLAHSGCSECQGLATVEEGVER